MITVLSSKGQVVIPNEVRSRLGLRAGDNFTVLSSDSGDILLKPFPRRPVRNWLQSLRALKGLEIRRTDELIRDTGL